MVAQTEDLRAALVANDLGGVGEVLHQGWLAKKKLASGISSARIDEWYERARRHGAIGGKITGAGGGGFLLLYAPPERHPAIREALSELPSLPIDCEPQGSKIIYVEENG
jgi:D-glycero-alpha-D-manno-heptose-7-phosphate kinase